MTDITAEDATYRRDGLLLTEERNTSTIGTFKAYFQSHDSIELLFSLLCIGSALLLNTAHLDPRQRHIPYQQLDSTGEYIVNQVNNEVYEGDTISGSALYLYGIILPFTIQMLISFYMGKNDLHKTLCVYGTALGLTMLVTNAVKLYVGYLRPVFYDICVPDETYENCSNENHNDARKSFPSGHASISFCGLGLLSFYLEVRFGVSSLRTWQEDRTSGELQRTQTRVPRLERILSIFCYAPFLLAIFIAASRVADNKHFPADVVGGTVLGTSIAKMVHGTWYD